MKLKRTLFCFLATFLIFIPSLIISHTIQTIEPVWATVIVLFLKTVLPSFFHGFVLFGLAMKKFKKMEGNNDVSVNHN
jgi:hypothetical protein